MADTETNTPLDADARRLALEAIATLAYVKKIAADQILRPAGVPEDLIQRFIKGRDPATGEALTKRQGGVIILDEMARLGSDRTALRKIINLAAGWNSFHLANNEYEARAVVQKAREFTGVLAEGRRSRKSGGGTRGERARCTRTQRTGKDVACSQRPALGSIRRSVGWR
jgi:hypothetical protein